MIALETTQNVPLTQAEDGTIRVTGSRVSLEAVVYQYEEENSAEKIHESFPSLRLADIYAVISYYLNHREQVNAYLHDQKKKAHGVRDDIESDPSYKSRVDELRRRIKSRSSSQHPSE
jgi:uncharacterized protein (DUF433 family)